MNTLQQYDTVLQHCREIYLKKTKDYGSSWRVLRPVSIVDQIYIKAWRIRQIQEKQVQKIEDSIESEFRAIVNYGIMAMIQLTMASDTDIQLSVESAEAYYNTQVEIIRHLMLDKNHDYGEAWRNMSQESFVDLILTKLLRIRQILANDGKTMISEGADANFADIVNYGIFALIRISEGT